MSETVQIALIVSIAPTIAAVAGFIVSLRNTQKLNTMHVDINSRLSAALLSERALGVEEGRRFQTEENDAEDKS